MYFIYSNITLKYQFKHSMCYTDHKLTKYMYFIIYKHIFSCIHCLVLVMDLICDSSYFNWHFL